MSKKAVIKSKEETQIIKGNELAKLLKIILIVTIIFGMFYGLTFIIKENEEYKYESPEDVTEIQYKEIAAGALLNQNSKEYYVLAYTKEEPYLNLYNGYIESYVSLKKKSVYTIDLNSGYNKKYLDVKSNFKFNDLKDLRFKQTTFLKIKDNSIKEVYETQISIEKILKELAKTK